MKKIYNHISILTTSFLILCCIVTFFSGCAKDAWTLYESHWDLKFPDDVKTEFHVSAIGFPSDGTSYSIFSFKSRPDEFLENFTQDDSNRYFEEFQKCLDSLPNDAKSVKKKYDESKVVMPKASCIWRKISKEHTNDSLYMAYEEDARKLYIVENLM